MGRGEKKWYFLFIEKFYNINLIKLLVNPIIGAIITGIAVIAGCIVSLFSNEIKDSFPFKLSFMSVYAIFFWGLFLIFLLLTSIRQFFIDKMINIQKDNMINTLQTLPPYDFSFKYEELFLKVNQHVDEGKKLYNLYDQTKDDLTEDVFTAIEKSIRSILDTYVNLAQVWDQPDSLLDKNIIYRANLMLYYNIASIPETIKNNISKYNKFFVEKNITSIIHSIDGILVLENNKLTTTTKTQNPDPDTEIEPLYFPVTLQAKKGKRYQNLPGAPKSIEENKVQYILDTSDIITFCKEINHFDIDTLEKITLYYSKETKAKSIISMPLSFLNNTNISYLGVLNIYRNRPLILKNEIRAKQFAAFLIPFNELLKKIVNDYINLKNI